LPKNNKTGIVGEKKEAFTFGRKTASASSENSVHLHRNTQEKRIKLFLFLSEKSL